MKKFNLKSKMGFTLIELLVVIGILAVLAAIAIPSVAGLIDRANVSADATNANEMTNAIERFTSEYELYCQDLASGRVKAGDLDSAQGRVFNVTGADSREDIELLESTGLDGKQINRDTKYPENVATMQALVENYMKTSSTTFTPKQSDCHYYYSPDCGLVVCTETNASSVDKLNALVQSGKDAKGNTLSSSTEWIDLTANVSVSGGNNTNPLHHNGIIPENATYTLANGTALSAGEEFPETPQALDSYKYGNYIYIYNASYCLEPYSSSIVTEQFTDSNYEGWLVNVIVGSSDSVEILEYINNKPVTTMNCTFRYNGNGTSPKIPSTVTDMSASFFGSGIETVTEIPSNVLDIREAFYQCYDLTGTITINTNPTYYSHCFDSVDFQSQKITLTGSSTMLDEIGATGWNYCANCNGYCSCGAIQ